MRLPILDDAHHWSGQTHIDGLSHFRQEVLLDLKAPLSNAPAPIHQEGQVHFTISKIEQDTPQAYSRVTLCLIMHKV